MTNEMSYRGQPSERQANAKKSWLKRSVVFPDQSYQSLSTVSFQDLRSEKRCTLELFPPHKPVLITTKFLFIVALTGVTTTPIENNDHET
jgi:hypothetical protein